MQYPMIAFNKIHRTTAGPIDRPAPDALMSAFHIQSALSLPMGWCGQRVGAQLIAPDRVRWPMPQAEHQIRH
jgi:hypothetical protein